MSYGAQERRTPEGITGLPGVRACSIRITGTIQAAPPSSDNEVVAIRAMARYDRRMDAVVHVEQTEEAQIVPSASQAVPEAARGLLQAARSLRDAHNVI